MLFYEYNRKGIQAESIFTAPPHKYGYYFNVNHPLINKKYSAWNNAHGVTRWNRTEADRKEFEKEFIQSDYFKDCLSYEISKNGKKFFDLKIQMLLERNEIEWQ